MPRKRSVQAVPWTGDWYRPEMRPSVAPVMVAEEVSLRHSQVLESGKNVRRKYTNRMERYVMIVADRNAPRQPDLVLHANIWLQGTGGASSSAAVSH